MMGQTATLLRLRRLVALLLGLLWTTEKDARHYGNTIRRL